MTRCLVLTLCTLMFLPPLADAGRPRVRKAKVAAHRRKQRLRRITVHNVFGTNKDAGKVVVITGATSGLGRAVAMEYARRGAKVVAVGRRQERLTELQNEALGQGFQIVGKVADVTNESDMKQLAADVHSTFGHVDRVVANAGVGEFQLAHRRGGIAEQRRQKIWATNYDGVRYTVDAFHKFLAEVGGSVSVSGSLSAYVHLPQYSDYAASKAAVKAWLGSKRQESREFARQGKTEHAVAMTYMTMGFAPSEMLFHSGGENPNRFIEVPQKRMAKYMVDATASRREEVAFGEIAKAAVRVRRWVPAADIARLYHSVTKGAIHQRMVKIVTSTKFRRAVRAFKVVTSPLRRVLEFVATRTP